MEAPRTKISLALNGSFRLLFFKTHSLYRKILLKNNILLLLSVAFFAACDVPRDPRDSFQEALSNELLVGVTHNPPYVEIHQDSITGSEVELIKNFAKKENLQLTFVEDSESNLVKKLEKYELHVLLGGFEKKTHWKKKTGPTASYDKKHVLLVPKGENKLLQKIESFIFKEPQK